MTVEEKAAEKPFWSARVKFINIGMLEKAMKELKHFTMNGYQIRLLKYEQNLVKAPHVLSKDQHSISSSFKHSVVSANENETFSLSVLTSTKKNKPDNSEERCNLVVKGLDPEMTEKNLEKFFTKFGNVKSCKIAKDPETGKSRTYGFIWFENPRDATRAMNEKKAGKIEFSLEWYQIISQRVVEQPNKLLMNNKLHNKVMVTWKP